MSEFSEKFLMVLNGLCGAIFGYVCFHAFLGIAFSIAAGVFLGVIVVRGAERLLGAPRFAPTLAVNVFALGLLFIAIWQKAHGPSFF